MKGIKLSHGAIFVEHNGVTVCVEPDGTCELSSRALSSVEWDLRDEPPRKWDYIYDRDVDALGDGVRAKIEEIVKNYYEILEG